MEKKEIPKFPKGFFQRKMPIKPLSEAIKDSIPLIWNDPFENVEKEKKLSKKKA